MACVAVTSLVSTLELEFLQPLPRPIVQQNDLISGNRELIESLCEKLESLMDRFDESRMDGVEVVKVLETKLRDVAFRVENEIEYLVLDLYETEENSQIFYISHLHGEKPQGGFILYHILQQAIIDIDHIKEELVKVEEEEGCVNAATCFLPGHDELMLMGASQPEDDIMVGKDKEFQSVKDMLIEYPSKQREIISIEGMAGVGKTTLARRVYQDPSVALHFDVRAWVVVSQHHDKKKMLFGILNSMGKSGESGHDEELELRLYQSLKGQRYLVVMDDLWSGEAWDAVKACFPDDGNGSRVLLTTRLTEVVSHTGSKNDFSHRMHLLDESESWALFCKKVSLKGARFEAIGRQIVDICSGLPLAILVAAGLFSKLNTLEEWKNIAKDLNSSSTTLAGACSIIFSLSYNHLPYKLKACFLHLGVFPEDEKFSSSNLEKLWIAEGFVKTSKSDSSEAVKYIQELSDRNLILDIKQSTYERRIQSFRMHDLMHAFCVNEGQKENILHIFKQNSSNFPQKDFRWLSIQSSNVHIPKICSSKSCRSIYCFKQRELSFLDLLSFSLLRVVVGEECRIIAGLAHMRFLYCSWLENITELKPFSAWNLQLFFVGACRFPYILECPQIQCLVSNLTCELYPPKFVHQNLQFMILRPSHCTKELLTNTPFLKEVVIGNGSGESMKNCLENLACLQQLEKLEVFIESGARLPPINKFLSLKKLKRLALDTASYQWKDINSLSILPMLQQLKLRNFVYSGQEWEITEEVQFLRLMSLSIDTSNLEHWDANDGNFPKLEHLKLIACYKLKEIPSCFAEIQTLKSIRLIRCLPSAVISAKQIQEEQRDYGNSDMVVTE